MGLGAGGDQQAGAGSVVGGEAGEPGQALHDVQLVGAVISGPEPGLPPQCPRHVTLLCRELLPRQTEVGQLLVVAPHGDLLLGHTVPVTVTLGTVNVPGEERSRDLV